MGIYRTHVTATNFNECINTDAMKIKQMNDGSVWARIHWLDVKKSSTYYTSPSDVLESNGSTKFSRMKLVDKLYTTNVTLKNIAPKVEGVTDFGGSYSTSSTTRLYGNSSLQITANAAAVETLASSKATVPYVSGHVYYATYRFYQSSIVGSSQFFWPINGSYSFGTKAATTANTWVKAGFRHSSTVAASGNYQCRFDFNNNNASGTMLFDGLVIIDLTEAFGSGSEPSVDWCNENIPYFEGEITIDAATAGFKRYEFMLNFPEMNIQYTRLNCIKSTGTQYINTGVITNQNTRIEIKASSNSNYSIYGAGKAWTNFTANATGGYFYYNDYAAGASRSIRANDGKGHLFVQDKNKCYIDKALIHTFPTASFTSPSTLLLFGRNNNSGALDDAGGTVAIYYCKIYDNDVLIRDFIPIKDSNGTPCMLERLSKTLYYNAGTGSFTAGTTIKEEEMELFNRWTQVGSPNESAPTGYQRISTQWTAHAGPLRRSTGSAMYDCDNVGSTTWFVPIGQTAAWSGTAAIPPAHGSGQTDAKNEIELWVRIDNLAPAQKALIHPGNVITGSQFYEI